MNGLLGDIEIVADSRLPLVNKIADSFGCSVVHADMHSFADTESVVHVADQSRLKDKIVLIVSQFSFVRKKVCQDSVNDQLVQTLLLAHQIKEHCAKKIIAVMPYLPYSRQCKSDGGLSIGALQAIGKFCSAVGIDNVISCELHESMCSSVFSLPLHEIQLHVLWHDLLSEKLLPQELDNLCFVSPDYGGVDRVKKVASLFNAPWAFVEKKRVEHDKSVAINFVGDVQDKIVILLDDIIDTGRTAVEASKLVFKHGASRILGCFVHGVFAKGSIELIEESNIEKIWVTNSIALDAVELSSKCHIVSLDHVLISYLKRFLKKG